MSHATVKMSQSGRYDERLSRIEFMERMRAEKPYVEPSRKDVDRYMSALEDLDALYNLPEDWSVDLDGDVAPRPSVAALERARVFVFRMASVGLAPDDVDADVLGGVALGWCRPPLKPGWHAWLAIHNSGALVMIVTDGCETSSYKIEAP